MLYNTTYTYVMWQLPQQIWILYMYIRIPYMTTTDALLTYPQCTAPYKIITPSPEGGSPNREPYLGLNHLLYSEPFSTHLTVSGSPSLFEWCSQTFAPFPSCWTTTHSPIHSREWKVTSDDADYQTEKTIKDNPLWESTNSKDCFLKTV